MSVSWLELVLFVLLPFVGFPIAAIFSMKKDNEKWYDKLSKPSWGPPKLAFPIAWTIVWVCIGVASYLYWKKDGGAGGWVIYALQLLLSWVWPAIFWGLKDLKLAFLEIAVVFVLCVANGIVFGMVDYVALLLFIPYWVWMMWLVPDMYFIWRNNPKA